MNGGRRKLCGFCVANAVTSIELDGLTVPVCQFHADEPPSSAPSSAPNEGVRARVEAAWEEVRERLNREHRENIISYRELKAGVNNAALIRDAALSPSPALIPDAAQQREATADDFGPRKTSDEIVEEALAKLRADLDGIFAEARAAAREVDAATPAIRDQAFEEAAQLANRSRAVRLHDETLPDRIRALKGTSGEKT